MCMFTEPVRDVSKTKIFAAELFAPQTPLQITIYTNTVQLENGNPVAMILPCPNPSGDPDRIKVFDSQRLSNSFFDNLATKFQFMYRNGGSRSMSRSKSYIEVERIGNYKVSRVGSYSDFDRLKTTEFKLDSGFQEVFKQHYNTGFSFVVCILNDNVKDPEPIVYTSPLINSQLFIPTRHYHGGSEEKPDWDHSIYFVSDSKHPTTNTPNSKYITIATKSDKVIESIREELMLGFLPSNIKDTSNLSQLKISEGVTWNDDIVVN